MLFACIISGDGSASSKRDSIDFYRYLAVELSPPPPPPPFLSVCLSFPFALYGCRLLFPHSPSAPFYLFLLPPFRSPSPPFRAFWLCRFFRATLHRQHPSRILKEKESWVSGIENLNTHDPEGRFYAKCALSNDEKTRFLPSHERGPVTKNYFLEYLPFPTSNFPKYLRNKFVSAGNYK